jgi:hypothetical protein
MERNDGLDEDNALGVTYASLRFFLATVEVAALRFAVPVSRKSTRPGDAMNVSRIEHENLESAVRENHNALQRVERKVDDVARDVAELKRLVRSITTRS